MFNKKTVAVTLLAAILGSPASAGIFYLSPGINYDALKYPVKLQNVSNVSNWPHQIEMQHLSLKKDD